MKKLIRDHIERWAAIFVGYFLIGFFFQAWTLHDKKVFPPSSFQALFFIGIYPLSRDLQQRHFTALFTLPITARQIGRAWWLVSVGLPVLLLATSIGLGTLILFWNSKGEFPVRIYFENNVANLLYLGTIYYVIMAAPTKRPHALGEYVEFAYFIGMTAYSFIELFRLQTIQFYSNEGITFLLVAATITFAGWVNAEKLISRRAGIRIAAASSAQSAQNKPRLQNSSNGLKGIPSLFAAMFVRTFLSLIFVGALISAPFFSFHANSISLDDFESAIPVLCIFPVYIIVMFQIFPNLQQLRLLRTLPMSTLSLASLLVLLPTATILIFEALMTVPVLAIAGLGKCSICFGNFFGPAIFIAWCIPLAVTLGANRQTYFLILLFLGTGLAVFQIYFSGKLPLQAITPIALILIPASIFLTKKALICSGNAYRTWPNLLGTTWGWGR
jgi:hypothetical protein